MHRQYTGTRSTFRRATRMAAAMAGASLILATLVTAEHRENGRWVGTWSASPQAAASPVQLNGQTLRQIVRTSVGGERVRVRFSNAYGTERRGHRLSARRGQRRRGGDSRAIRSNAQVQWIAHHYHPRGSARGQRRRDARRAGARRSRGQSLSPGECFRGNPARSRPADELPLDARRLHGRDHVRGDATQSFYFLTAVEVRASEHARAIVTIGDSVTDGFASTPDMNQRWPNLLADRLQSRHRTSDVSVLNAGVSGNRILHDLVGTGALARFDRDVLAQTGARYLIVLQGNADILIPDLIGAPAQNVTAEQIIQGHRQIINRARAMGLRVYGGTLNPVEGYPFPGFWTPAMEAKRQAVNHWIRTSNAYDAVIEFDKCCAIRPIPRACCPPTTAATMCIRMTSAIGQWPMRSTCRCSWRATSESWVR